MNDKVFSLRPLFKYLLSSFGDFPFCYNYYIIKCKYRKAFFYNIHLLPSLAKILQQHYKYNPAKFNLEEKLCKKDIFNDSASINNKFNKFFRIFKQV
jgi:hypothetical protein